MERRIDLKPMTDLPTLRQRLSRHVLVPMAIMWLLGTGFSVGVAYHYAAQAFDRSLLDDAYALATHVHANDKDVQLKLTSRELGTLLFDQSESIYFAVWRRDGEFVSGHPWLRAMQDTPGPRYQFADQYYQGKSLRTVSVQNDQGRGYVVVMAQTTTSRTKLLERLLLFSLGPQAVLLLILAAWLRHAIQTDLRPLSDLQHGLSERDASDLTPVVIEPSTQDLQNLGQTVNALLTRVSDGIQAHREFAGNVAHELRTPLAGIRALAEYGLAQKEPDTWHRQLKAIADSEARASHMIGQLLDLALADEQRDSLRLYPIELDRLVRNIVLQTLQRADDLGVELTAQGLDQVVVVSGDEGLIEGILRNLLDNALRYGRPTDSTPPSIVVSLEKHTTGVVLQVIDNGIGIVDLKSDQVLRRWTRQNESSGAAGFGLGLNIVSRYAELLGAAFRLDPGPNGCGVCASVRW